MKMPDLSFRPTPAFERYAREARARQRREQRRIWWRRHCAWWYRHIEQVGIGALAAFALAVVVGGVVKAERDAHRPPLQCAPEVDGLRELVISLARGPDGRYQLRLAADGPDEAIVQLDRMRAVLVAERGAAQP